MIEIAELLKPAPSPLWKLVRQCGVSRAVAVLPFGDSGDEKPWDFMPLLRMKTRFNDHGFEVSAIESSPPMTKTRLGLPGRDEEIEWFIEMVRNMGRLGIPVVCYNWMAVVGWLRTSFTLPARGGAIVSGFDADQLRNAPLTEYGEVPEEQLWSSLEYFLRAVVPEAEASGVKLAMHPDDPPLSPIRGIGRIMRSVENFQRLIDLLPSPANGITLCQGNFALMTSDLPGTIRRFGEQGRVHFVHMRDVEGTPERFSVTFL
jgi:mannonate dehydratase